MVKEIVGKVRVKLGCSEAEARKYLAEHVQEFSPAVRDKIIMAFFVEELEKKTAEEGKKPENVNRVREELEQEIADEGVRASPEKKMPVLGAAAMGLLEKLMNDFGEDTVGGMKFLGKHFDEIPEPDRSELFKILCDRDDEFPEEAKQDLAMLGFRCDAGRQRMIDNLERSKDKCPPELRRTMYGD